MGRNLKIVSPFKTDDIQKFKDFERKVNIDQKISSSLEHINVHYTEKEYQQLSIESNTISQVIALEYNDFIQDGGIIQGEKDTKFATIELVPVSENYRTRELLDSAVEYCLGSFETVAVLQNKEDKSLKKIIERKDNYEPLEEVNGFNVYIIEKNRMKESEIKRCAV